MGLWQQQVTFLSGWIANVPQLLSPAQRDTWETAGEAEACQSVLNLVVSGPEVPGLGTWGEEHVHHFLGY